MNGIFEITVKRTKHKLMFRMKAAQILKMRAANSVETTGTVDEFKAFVYLVYAGMCNYAESLDLVYPTYEYVYELVDDLLNESDSIEQQTKLWQCFNESKAGENLQEFIKAVSVIKTDEVEVEQPVKKKKVQKTSG